MTERSLKTFISSVRLQALTPFYVMELLGRAKAMERAGRDIIHMEIGEPDFATPACVVAAGIEALRTDAIHYTAAAGLMELRQAIAGHYQERYGLDFDPGRIFVTPGASGALLLVLAAVLETGDEVLLEDPGYPCYANFVRVLGGVPRPWEVTADSNFHLDPESASRAWTPLTRGLITASPANPTGALLSEAQLVGLARMIDERRGFWISDEIYHGLEYGARSRSALEFSSRAFVVNSFSKYYGMTGWRLGWAVVPEEHVEIMERLAQNLFIAAPTHSQLAALAAFTPENRVELERRRSLFQQRRDFLLDALQSLGFGLPVRPEGAFYVYADCSGFTDDSFDFAYRLLEESGVAVTPGKDFGLSQARRFLRFAYTLSQDRMEQGMERIEAFLLRSRGKTSGIG